MDFRVLVPMFLSMIFLLLVGVPLQKAKISLLITLPILLFAVFYPLVVRIGTPLYIIDWPWYHAIIITDEGLRLGLSAMLRTYMIALGAFVFWITTSPEEMARGLENLRINPKLAMIVSMTMNFIPSMLDKLFSIIEAQKARGSEIGSGRFMGKIRSFARVSSPLIYTTMERAQTVSLLLSVRGFGLYPKRTCIHEYTFAKKDYVILGVYLAFLLVSLVLGYGFRMLATTF
jgi:energy-coupling factor transport system permease protein